MQNDLAKLVELFQVSTFTQKCCVCIQGEIHKISEGAVFTLYFVSNVSDLTKWQRLPSLVRKSKGKTKKEKNTYCTATVDCAFDCNSGFIRRIIWCYSQIHKQQKNKMHFSDTGVTLVVAIIEKKWLAVKFKNFLQFSTN